MSDKIVSLEAARADRENDNGLISPVTLLRDFLREIESGGEGPKSLLIVGTYASDDGTLAWRYRMAQINRMDAIALCELVKHAALGGFE